MNVNRHRAKVVKDNDRGGLWSAICDCGNLWDGTKWKDVYAVAFNHVRAAAIAERRGGIGFRSDVLST